MARRWITAAAALLGAALVTPLPPAQAAGFTLGAPARVRTDGTAVNLPVGQIAQGAANVRLRFTLTAPDGTVPADLELLAPDPATYTMQPLDLTVEPDGDLVGVFGPATGFASFPGFNFGSASGPPPRSVRCTSAPTSSRSTASGTELGVRESAAADTVLYAEAPHAPRFYFASPADHGAVVNWRAPADDGGRPVTGYTVTAHPDDVSGPGSDVTATVTERAVRDAARAVRPRQRPFVHRRSGRHQCDRDSAPVTATVVPGPPPAVPVITTADPAYGGLRVRFAPAASGAPPVTDHSFEQQWNGEDWEPVSHALQPDGSVLVWIPTEVEVLVRVRAYNDSGYSGYSATTGPVAALEPPPADLTATSSVATDGTVRVAGDWAWPTHAGGTWPAQVCITPGSSPAPSGCAGFTVTGKTSFAARDVGLDPGTDYTVTVRFDREIHGGDALPHGRWSDPSWVTLTSTTVTAADTSLKIESGDALTLSGRLSGLPEARGLRTAVTMPPVTLWSRTAGVAAWTKARTVTPDATGRFSATGLRPVLTTTYQWRYAGDSESLGDVSPADRGEGGTGPDREAVPRHGLAWRLGAPVGDGLPEARGRQGRAPATEGRQLAHGVDRRDPEAAHARRHLARRLQPRRPDVGAGLLQPTARTSSPTGTARPTTADGPPCACTEQGPPAPRGRLTPCGAPARPPRRCRRPCRPGVPEGCMTWLSTTRTTMSIAASRWAVRGRRRTARAARR